MGKQSASRIGYNLLEGAWSGASGHVVSGLPAKVLKLFGGKLLNRIGPQKILHSLISDQSGVVAQSFISTVTTVASSIYKPSGDRSDVPQGNFQFARSEGGLEWRAVMHLFVINLIWYEITHYSPRVLTKARDQSADEFLGLIQKLGYKSEFGKGSLSNFNGLLDSMSDEAIRNRAIITGAVFQGLNFVTSDGFIRTLIAHISEEMVSEGAERVS